MVIEPIASDPQLKGLCELLHDRKRVVHVSGLWGSAAPMVAASVASATKRTVLYLSSRLDEADHAQDDLELFSGGACLLFPAWETLPGEGAAAGEIEAERLRLAGLLMDSQGQTGNDLPLIIASPIQAMMQPLPRPEVLRQNTLSICTGEASSQLGNNPPDELLKWAIDRGYERLDMIEAPGDIAKRGDIVDIFAPGEVHPYRIQFFDDEVESVRKFDISTQRSHEQLHAVSLVGLPRSTSDEDLGVCSLLDFLPDDALVVLDAPFELQDMGQTFKRRLDQTNRLFSVTDILADANKFGQMHLSRFGDSRSGTDESVQFNVTSLTRFEGKAAEAVESLAEVAADHRVFVLCDNEGEKQRLEELLASQPKTVMDSISVEVGVMHSGFEWSSARTVVVAHHELFHRDRPRRRLRKIHASRPIESWMDLKPGDIVVHVVHGIGLFTGLKRMRKGTSGQLEEFLSVEYDDGAGVHVPISQIDLVQKYIGAGGLQPKLSKLGGKRWSKTKDQVEDAVSEMAEQLLRIQAARETGVGMAYPPDTNWQREFEASFIYEETEDQLVVASDIRGDLTRPRPMDRLICGDVGYGKTELAMRAAFKVVEFGKQVAVLVPTTVLAEQHYKTFLERMADYPFSIGCLSRFRSAGEQRKIVSKAKRGQVDIVIGTHRILSKDVEFADLGLVIIDEEQRFGVEHKERLRAMRETVDVLTLTATPIPRTLHMSLVGIRDISALQTPPVDRRSIATQVRAFDRSLVRDAIIRELNRDGQVYFVHNFVRDIQSVADRIQTIVPEARVVFGHGQMKGRELEQVMHRFLRREADVLVATTIIESGIDIPSANTIFINNAHRFGLADLHQLRGRVGRSKHKAYCYLLVPPDRPLEAKATKRLKAVEEFSELGAGFQIAMRDLEIRGAGNLLGREQSGHIAMVGYELYCQMLDRAVRRLKNEPEPRLASVQLDLDVVAHIPSHYIASDRSRIEVYRRLATCQVPEDLDQLEKDLLDTFGKYPSEVGTMLDLAGIRVAAQAYSIRTISRRPPDVIFSIESMARAESVFADAPGSVRMPDNNTIHLRLPDAYLEPPTLLAVLRRMFNRAKDKTEQVS